MKIQHILASFALALLAASCTEKEIEVPDNSVRDYTLGVTNDNYTATTVLDGIGNTRIVEVLNQPAWVSEVKREDNLLGGSMVLAVTVKSDPSLEDIRSAHLSIKMSNGATANLEVTQRAGLPVGFNADESPSVNVDFEADWSSAMSVKLVTSVQTIIGRDQVITEDTPLPWNDTDPGTKCNVPDDVIESMLNHKENWLLAFNTTGNAGMATAGSGDVLTGIITGLLARGYKQREACMIGVYLHGLAGDIAASELGEESLIASDIIQYLPKAFLKVKK